MNYNNDSIVEGQMRELIKKIKNPNYNEKDALDQMKTIKVFTCDQVIENQFTKIIERIREPNFSEKDVKEAIEQFKEIKAFTHKDQMILNIVDCLKFNIWAADRDCIITFWTGNCEEYYGIKEKDAIGKNFVELFVKEEEKEDAIKMQKEIIDKKETQYHSFANDYARTAQTNLILSTFDAAIKDIETGDYWNAEMAFRCDPEKALNKLNSYQEIAEDVKKIKEEFYNIFNSFKKQKNILSKHVKKIKKAYETISSYEGKRVEFCHAYDNLNKNVNLEALDESVQKLKELIDGTYSLELCKKHKEELYDKMEELDDWFSNVKLDLSDVAYRLNIPQNEEIKQLLQEDVVFGQLLENKKTVIDSMKIEFEKKKQKEQIQIIANELQKKIEKQ